MVRCAKAKYPPTLTDDEAVEFLLDHAARNGGGLLDWNAAKQIAEVPFEKAPNGIYRLLPEVPSLRGVPGVTGKSETSGKKRRTI